MTDLSDTWIGYYPEHEDLTVQLPQGEPGDEYKLYNGSRNGHGVVVQPLSIRLQPGERLVVVFDEAKGWMRQKKTGGTR